jgi:hypothetical protein
LRLPHRRPQIERALERVLDGDGPEPLRLAALAACRVIGTPRLLGAVERSLSRMDETRLAALAEVAEPRARIVRHARQISSDRNGILFLLDKAVRDPGNPVADKLLDQIDIRDLYAVWHASFDDDLRAEAARRLARRGPHQRARLMMTLDLDPDAFGEQLAFDVRVDDLDGTVEITLDDLAFEMSASP